MAAVDYYGILSTLKGLLEADSSLSGVTVRVEEDPSFDVQGGGKALVLMLDSRREAPGQPIAAGKRTRWHVRVSIWAIASAMTFDEASRLRDDLMGALELVLMNNRTVSGKWAAAWIEGGDFLTVRQAEGSYALGETVFVGEATAIAT